MRALDVTASVLLASCQGESRSALVRAAEGGSTAIVAVHQIPSLTRERYEEVVRRLTNGKGRLESPSGIPFEGLLVHAAAQTETGFLVFDVFESEEAFNRFVEAVRPIAQEVGIEEPPKAYSAHTFISS